MTSRRLFEELAARLRKARETKGFSLQEAAERAGVSRRFLVEVEAARTNPSIGKLAALATAYSLKLGTLCDLPLSGAPPTRIALIGLRGAGKSTIGRRLAESLEVPFSELDEVIREMAGLTVEEIFELHGEAGYRRFERDALEDWLARHGSGVLAVSGGLVSSREVYARLRETCRTVWLKARPEDHWERVKAQGDLRPMRSHPEAMDRLRALLVDREPLYRLAEIELDTSGSSPEQTVESALTELR